MFGLKKRPYPGRELKSFWCDSDDKKLTFHNFSGYFSFAHFGHHKKFGNTLKQH